MRGIADLTRRFDLSVNEAARLSRFDDLLLDTAEHTNLVARASLQDRWSRHYADSLQLWPLLPSGASTLLDVGAGAGFPGIPLAILAASRMPQLRLTLADSIGKKARFLATAIDALGLANAEATSARVEALRSRYDVVTARAVTSLPSLLDLAVPRLAQGGTMVFPKGRRAEEELKTARARWRLATERVQSETDPDATILVITKAEGLAT